MRLIFISALFLLPFIEIWGLFKFGSMYGWWFFLYIVVMAILGWQLIQDEKALVLGKLMGMIAQGGNLAAAILGSAKNLLAGALFIFPGIFTDMIGFILLIIPIQTSINNNFQDFKSNKPTTKDDAIEGEYRREED
ncbi:MAG: FxsA family protein [Nitrosomonadales bacterium]|jgi:UPF0716 protein FxsA|nr:MAG: hypothetical protein ABS06_01420 [Methylophilales bacterium BACL14 MAG-120910-bin43]MBT6392383.1 FxsA family protein [Nitrosomonadales bacterium]|tara:strand:- start:16410 stop:16817 length:408 start_codon:yes stop_codon:yes gene_type:complete